MARDPRFLDDAQALLFPEAEPSPEVRHAVRPDPLDPGRGASRLAPPPKAPESGPFGGLATTGLPRVAARESFYERIRRQGPVQEAPAKTEASPEDWRAKVALLREAALGSCVGHGALAAPIDGRIPPPYPATETLVKARVSAQSARAKTRETAATHARAAPGRSGPMRLLV